VSAKSSRGVATPKLEGCSVPQKSGHAATAKRAKSKCDARSECIRPGRRCAMANASATRPPTGPQTPGRSRRREYGGIFQTGVILTHWDFRTNKYRENRALEEKECKNSLKSKPKRGDKRKAGRFNAERRRCPMPETNKCPFWRPRNKTAVPPKRQ